MILRRIGVVLVLLLAAAIVIATGLWAWTGSDRSLQWAWDQVAPAHGLQAQALRGSLREGLRAKRLRWVLEDWEVEAEDVAITWQTQDLPALGERRELRIRRVEAGSLRLQPRQRAAGSAPGPTPGASAPAPASPGAAPTRLQLPIALRVDELRLGRFEIAGGWALRDLVGRYRYDRRQHEVALQQARITHDTLGTLALAGQARLGAEPPLPLDLRLQGRWEQRPDQALALQAHVQGPLSLLDLDLALHGTGGEQQATLRARLAPWALSRWQALQAELTQVDPGAWWPGAPRARLSGRLSLVPYRERAAPGLLRLQLHNTLPGPSAEGRLPLADIEAEADIDADLLRALRLQLGLPAGPRWQMRLQSPVAWRREGAGGYALGPGTLLLSAPAPAADTPVRLAWEQLRWGGGRLQTRGTLRDLPMAWLALVLAQPPPGDLVFDGDWDLRMDGGLALRARLARTRGDLRVLAETAEGLSARVAAGVRVASLDLATEDGAAPGRVRLALHWDSERAGRIDARLATHLARHASAGWHWSADAPLEGRMEARLPRLSVWSLLAPAGWRLRGTLAADLALTGTWEAPRWSGALSAEGLGLRSVVDGVALRDGRLRARLIDRTLFIDTLQFLGQDLPDAPGSGGSLQARGEGRWPEGGEASLVLDASLSRLRASLRPDRLLTLSGQAQAEVAAVGPRAGAGFGARPSDRPPQRPVLRLEAELQVDQARITLPDRATPQLGEDVVVRGLPPGVQLEAARRGPGQEAALPLQLRARIALGPDFRVSGRGLEAQARGQLEATARTWGDWQLVGSADMAGGQYQAFGQRLRLTRGLLRFTGPPRDPALDLLAQRPTPPGESQQVGVQVTGRAQSPRVRLWSEPALPQAQALSWLALGRASASGGSETALLEDLAVSMLTRRAGLGGGTLAQRLGLDELSLRRDSGSGAASGAAGTGGSAGGSGAGLGAPGATLAVGKRLSQDLYAVYERGLSGVLGSLRVFYDLSRRLQLRLEAGDRSGVDLVYTVTRD